MKWNIGTEGGYMTILDAETKEEARRKGKSEMRGRFGTPAWAYDQEITSVKPATDFDVEWFALMGGEG